jgi:UDPglucose 6-dehydrogenase
MNIAIFGAGYVGLSLAACLAEAGHAVLCADADAARIDRLQRGQLPLHEPGLPALVAAGLAAGTLRFTSDERAACLHGDVLFIVVNTPADARSQAPVQIDVRHVLDVAQAIGRHGERDALVVCKSTVPVGTADRVEAMLHAELARRGARHRVAVAANPEFLREGAAVRDCRQPDRVLIGARDAWAIEQLTRLYRPFLREPQQLIVMDRRSAELSKYAANAMLAARISFMNEMALVAEQTGADIEQVRRAIGADRRIGPEFLRAGAGYGGSCLGKDVRALLQMAEAPLPLLAAVESVNQAQKARLFALIARHFDDRLAGRTIAVWGLAFKPETDDMRDAPSLTLLAQLRAAGAQARVYDPAAMANARALIGDCEQVHWCASADEALHGAEALVLMTEWDEFRRPDLAHVARTLARASAAPALFEGRNVYEAADVEAAGMAYHGFGRGCGRVSGQVPGRESGRDSSLEGDRDRSLDCGQMGAVAC